MNGEIVYSIATSININSNEISKYPIPEINEMGINLTQLQRNYKAIRSLLNTDTKFMAILKGNAYGHGLIPIARELENCKCDAFGLVRLIEAYTLRNAGIKTPILMLSPIAPYQVSWVVEYNITPMIDNYKIIHALEKYAADKNKIINVHIKINTGLNRYGICSDKAITFIKQIHKECPHINIEGIYTHLQDPDFNTEMTHKQIKCFDELISNLEKENLRPKIAHIANSSGILKYPEAHYDMVRCGIILYGLEHKEGETTLPEGVKPLITLKARILKLSTIKKGEVGGYGKTFIAKRATKAAIVGIGFGDGVSRGWKEVLIAGYKVPIVNYFMDGIMVDITDLKEPVKEFDEAIIIGSQGNEQITWEDACRPLNSYIDEQIQHITERVPKYYFYE